MSEKFDVVVIGAGPGGYVASNQICEAWNEDRSDRRERSRRNVPEQGMYSGKSNDSCIDIIS